VCHLRLLQHLSLCRGIAHLLFDSNQRVLLLVKLGQHLLHVIVHEVVLVHTLLRQRRFDPQQVLEDLHVFGVDLLKLGLPVVVFPESHQLPARVGRVLTGCVIVVGRCCSSCESRTRGDTFHKCSSTGSCFDDLRVIINTGVCQSQLFLRRSNTERGGPMSITT